MTAAILSAIQRDAFVWQKRNFGEPERTPDVGRDGRGVRRVPRVSRPTRIAILIPWGRRNLPHAILFDPRLGHR